MANPVIDMGAVKSAWLNKYPTIEELKKSQEYASLPNEGKQISEGWYSSGATTNNTQSNTTTQGSSRTPPAPTGSNAVSDQVKSAWLNKYPTIEAFKASEDYAKLPDTAKQIGELRYGTPNINPNTVPQGDDEVSSFWDSVMGVIDPLKGQISDLRGENAENKKLFETKYNVAIQKAQELYDTSKQTTNALQDSFALLENQYGSKYSDVMSRIGEQEGLVDSKFSEMRGNLEKIGDAYKLMQQEQSAAEMSANEKQLRGLAGGASAARTQNVVAGQARDAAKNMAGLQAELAGMANTLEQNYLGLKNSLMQDKNLSDSARMDALDLLDNKFKQIEAIKMGARQQNIQDIYAPLEGEMGKQEQVLDQTVLSQKIQDANSSWKNTSPSYREEYLQNLVNSLVGKGYSVPKDLLTKARSAATLTDALMGILNTVKMQVAGTGTSSIDKVLSLLSGQNQSESENTEKVF